MPPRLNIQTHEQMARQRRMLKLKKALLARYLTMGLNLKEACILAQVSDYTLGLLRSDPEFETFIQRSTLLGKAGEIVNIKTAGGTGAWQASAWYLERKYPDEFGKKETIKHEMQIKVIMFQKVVMEVLNEVDPNVALKVMQKLRAIDVDSKVVAQQMTAVHEPQNNALLPAVIPTGDSWE